MSSQNHCSSNPLFHLITELKNQSQLLVTMKNIMEPKEKEGLSQVQKLAPNIPIPAQPNAKAPTSSSNHTGKAGLWGTHLTMFLCFSSLSRQISRRAELGTPYT